MAAPGTSSVPAPTAGNAEKLEIAKRLALRINAQKNLGIESQVLSNLFRVLVVVPIAVTWDSWEGRFKLAGFLVVQPGLEPSVAKDDPLLVLLSLLPMCQDDKGAPWHCVSAPLSM